MDTLLRMYKHVVEAQASTCDKGADESLCVLSVAMQLIMCS